MEHKRKLKLNIKFEGNKVICARSPDKCTGCKDIKSCEKIDFFYYPFNDRDIKECFRNNERRR